jgi:putative hydrolase of the HAD superfamily
MSIKTIFFDFGGVLVKQPNQARIHRWQRLFGIEDHPEINALLENPHESQLIKDICLGILPEDHLWKIMAEKWHIKPRMVEKIRQMTFSKRHLNKPMVQFLAECNKHYQTAILSNAGDKSRFVMEEIYHLDRHVEQIIISAEEGVIKPDPEIYRIAIEKLSAKPETSLLLDDFLENIEAAREYGMTAVHFINNDQAIRDVSDLLDHRE